MQNGLECTDERIVSGYDSGQIFFGKLYLASANLLGRWFSMILGLILRLRVDELQAQVLAERLHARALIHFALMLRPCVRLCVGVWVERPKQQNNRAALDRTIPAHTLPETR